VKRACFGLQGEIIEVEFFDTPPPQPGIAELMEMHEKEKEQMLAELPEDLKQRILMKQKEALAYASSV
jgi:hypothetical protein